MTDTLVKSGWLAIPARQECPVCGHKGFCTRTADGAVVKCMRKPNGRPIKGRDGQVGYLWNAVEFGDGKSLPIAKGAKAAPRLTHQECKLIHRRHRSALNTARVEKLAGTLGVTLASLHAYGVGWDAEAGCHTFPMFDGKRRICGLRRRWDNGSSKTCVPGSSNGLFVPDTFDGQCVPGEVLAGEDAAPLLIVLPEGPTSAAAAASIGLTAIGRPNNASGAAMLAELLRASHPADVILLADHEATKFRADGVPFWPGWEGALSVAEQIVKACHRLRAFKLQDRSGGWVKDVREFRQQGYGWAELLNLADDAAPVDEPWLIKAKRTVELRRERETKRVAHAI